jgi:hypothetical protein
MASRRNNGPTMGTGTVRLRPAQNLPSLPSERRAAERRQLLNKQEKQFREAMRHVTAAQLEDELEATLKNRGD